jgi:hypothetical protein
MVKVSFGLADASSPPTTIDNAESSTVAEDTDVNLGSKSYRQTTLTGAVAYPTFHCKSCKLHGRHGLTLPRSAFDAFPSGKRRAQCILCTEQAGKWPSTTGSRKRARNLVSNSVRCTKLKASTRARNVLAEFPVTNRTPDEIEALCTEATNAGIAKMRETVAALLRQPGCHRLLVYVFAAAYDDGRLWQQEGTRFLTKRGNSEPCLLDKAGNPLRTSLFTILNVPLVITDSHVVNDAAECLIQEEFAKKDNGILTTTDPRLIHCWKRNGAGSVRRGLTPGTTRKYCVGLAHSDTRHLPPGTTIRNWEATHSTYKPRMIIDPPPLPWSQENFFSLSGDRQKEILALLRVARASDSPFLTMPFTDALAHIITFL